MTFCACDRDCMCARIAGKTRALQQVKLANQYLEEHGSTLNREHAEEHADLMRKLGIATRGEVDMAADMKAATQVHMLVLFVCLCV